MKTFRELSTEVSENSFPVSNFLKGLEIDAANLESIVKRYSKGGFAIRMMEKGEYGDFSKDGAKIVKLANEALSIINEEFIYTVGRDEN